MGAGAATAGALGGGGAAARTGAMLGAPVGPPGGSVGSLMVGAAVGLGGKLIRTVSFFGCTLPVDFFSGSAPVGAPGNGFGFGFGGTGTSAIGSVKICGEWRQSNFILPRTQ